MQLSERQCGRHSGIQTQHFVPIYLCERTHLSHSLGTPTFNQSQFAVRLVYLKCKTYSAALKLQCQQNNLNILYGSQKFRLLWVYGRSVWNHIIYWPLENIVLRKLLIHYLLPLTLMFVFNLWSSALSWQVIFPSNWHLS